MAEIPDFKPNSNKYREQQKKEPEEHRLSKVAKGGVKKQQSSAIQKFAKSFLPEDAKSLKDYIADEAPGLIQGLLRRLLQNFLDTYLPDRGGYFSGRNRSFGGGTNTTVRYDSIRGGNSSVIGVKPRNTNTVYEYENVTFEFYEDAQDVLDGLFDCLSRYEKVRVFDLYDLAGVVANAVDRNYGWTDLRGSKIVSTHEGWVIDLPRAIPLT